MIVVVPTGYLRSRSPAASASIDVAVLVGIERAKVLYKYLFTWRTPLVFRHKLFCVKVGLHQGDYIYIKKKTAQTILTLL